MNKYNYINIIIYPIKSNIKTIKHYAAINKKFQQFLSTTTQLRSMLLLLSALQRSFPIDFQIT